MKPLVYVSAALLSMMALVGMAPTASATCILERECVSTIPQSQCLLELSGTVDLGIGCNGGTLTVICVIGDIGCFSINTPGCHLAVGITQDTMICVI